MLNEIFIQKNCLLIIQHLPIIIFFNFLSTNIQKIENKIICYVRIYHHKFLKSLYISYTYYNKMSKQYNRNFKQNNHNDKTLYYKQGKIVKNNTEEKKEEQGIQEEKQEEKQEEQIAQTHIKSDWKQNEMANRIYHLMKNKVNFISGTIAPAPSSKRENYQCLEDLRIGLRLILDSYMNNDSYNNSGNNFTLSVQPKFMGCY